MGNFTPRFPTYAVSSTRDEVKACCIPKYEAITYGSCRSGLKIEDGCTFCRAWMMRATVSLYTGNTSLLSMPSCLLNMIRKGRYFDPTAPLNTPNANGLNITPKPP